MSPGRGSVTRGRDPSLEIGVSMTREGEKIHKEEATLEHFQEIGPDITGMIGLNQEIEPTQEIIEEEVLPEIKIGEILEITRINQEREAKKYSRGALPADVKIA